MMFVPGSIPRMILSLFLRGSGGESCTAFYYIYQYNMNLKHKNKFGVALKVTIVFLAAGYIALRLFGKGNIHFSISRFFSSFEEHPFLFFAVVLLMPINWLIESMKWKIAASRSVNISLKESIKGVLAGVTVGTATPNRIGEFAGKIFMVREGDRMQLLLLSFIPSFAQVLVTVVAGAIGFMLHPEVAGLSNSEMFFLLTGTILVFILPFVPGIIPLRWATKMEALRTFPRKLFFQIIVLSILRYSIYVFQFLLVLMLTGANLEWKMALVCISVSYFIVTMIPTFSFTEVLLRGGIAGFVFSNGGAEFDLAFTAAVTLWTINVAVPSLIGSVFVFRLKFLAKEK